MVNLLMLGLILLTGAEGPDLTGSVKIDVASWNIGHFALGKSGDTKITYAQADESAATYRALIDSVDADIMSVVEYNPNFVNATATTPAIAARSAVFSSFENAQIGTKYSYNCNTIFSNGIKVLDKETKWFSVMVQKRYYLVSNMILDGDTVKVVSTHLDWNEGDYGSTYRTQQIQELIDEFKNDKYVILCGDWNVGSTSEYSVLVLAGYRMANCDVAGSILTFPAGPNARSYLDNIVAKGFNITNVGVRNRADLSDHMLIKATLVKKKNEK